MQTEMGPEPVSRYLTFKDQNQIHFFGRALLEVPEFV